MKYVANYMVRNCFPAFLFYTIYQIVCEHLVFRELTSFMYDVHVNRALYYKNVRFPLQVYVSQIQVISV